MLPPKARFNNFVQGTEDLHIDITSKVFMACLLAIGLNRLPVINRISFVVLAMSFLYVLAIHGYVLFRYIGNDITGGDTKLFIFFSHLKLIQYCFCTVMGLAFWKRLQQYYVELDKLDKDTATKTKTEWKAIVLLVLIFGMYSATLYWNPTDKGVSGCIVFLLHTVETYYYSHLFFLLSSKIDAVNNCIEESLRVTQCNGIYKDALTTLVNNKDTSMKSVKLSASKLMDIYNTIINAYYTLNDAIKWQLLFIIMTSFCFMLSMSYKISLHLLGERLSVMAVLPDILVVVAELIALVPLCMRCDDVRAEVRRLKELVASKLYDKNLAKPCRSTLRALMALTDTRNLSFSLLRVVEISISLPFYFVELLITYLIILLQFEKVISMK